MDGCRHPLCRAANTAYHREYRARQRNEAVANDQQPETPAGAESAVEELGVQEVRSGLLQQIDLLMESGLRPHLRVTLYGLGVALLRALAAHTDEHNRIEPEYIKLAKVAAVPGATWLHEELAEGATQVALALGRPHARPGPN